MIPNLKYYKIVKVRKISHLINCMGNGNTSFLCINNESNRNKGICVRARIGGKAREIFVDEGGNVATNVVIGANSSFNKIYNIIMNFQHQGYTCMLMTDGENTRVCANKYADRWIIQKN